jgi:hypothetical protein
MEKTTYAIRVVALDLRPRRFGFAVLEGPHRLLDWGIRAYPTQPNKISVVRKRIAPLLRMFSPSVVVLPRRMSSLKKCPGLQVCRQMVRREALRRSIQTDFVGKQELKQVFEQFGSATKYQIASRIALMFPELTWKLPAARKPWQTEPHNQTIFDAIALGLTYFARSGTAHLESDQKSQSNKRIG